MSNHKHALKLLILTPERKFLEKEVSMVTVPAFLGEMGILPDHISTVAALQPGLIRIYEGNVVVEAVFVNGGFIEITQEQVTILIEDIIEKSQVNSHACICKDERS